MLEQLLATLSQYLQTLPYIVPSVLLAVVAHEYAHGWMSDRLGDPTPRATGRLSLNPLRHLDPMGTLCLLLFRMGWAKPVMIDPRYYREPKKGIILVALAGPVMNFGLALLFSLLRGLILRFAPYSELTLFLYQLASYCAAINVSLGVFNLIPIPPLDGSKIIGNLIPWAGRLYVRFRQFWRPLLLVLLFSGLLSQLLYWLNDTVHSFIWNIVMLLLGL